MISRRALPLLAIFVLGAGCTARASLGGAEPAPGPRGPNGSGDGDADGDGHGGDGHANGGGAEAFPPGDWSLAERSSWKRIYAAADQNLNLMNSNCGTGIEMTYDHDAFRDRLPATDANHGEDWNVSAHIMEIRNVCLAGADEKGAVAQQIQTIYFVRAPANHALEDGTLQVALDLEANPRAYINDFAAWLRSSL